MGSNLEIYGTMGPSCAEVEILRKMFAAGINGMRLNLSHGTIDDSAHMIEAFHTASGLEGVKPSLLIDMQGPELRIGTVRTGFVIGQGEEVLMSVRGSSEEGAGTIPVPEEIFANYEPGMILMIDDGKIHLRVTGHEDTEKERRLPEKELRVVGMPYMDKMLKRVQSGSPGPGSCDPKTVLLAPSWGKSAILSRYGDKIFEALLKTDYHIIVRPHPQSFTSEQGGDQRCR